MFVGIGLALAFGLLLIGVLILGLFSLIFGQGFSCSTIGFDNQANKIPQQFNQCLLATDLDLCRTQYTVWSAEQSKLVTQLAKQVREELGERLPDSTQSTEISQNTINGEVTITINEESDFARKKGVREHYVIVKDGKDKVFKIKDLNWDYGDASPIQNP